MSCATALVASHRRRAARRCGGARGGDRAGAHRSATAIVAILGKTEGNGCVNDFTRAFAVRALSDALAASAPTPRPTACRW